MQRVWRARLRWILKAGCIGALVPVAAAVLYLLAAVLLALLPANPDAEAPADGIEIFLVSNGVHVELAVPARAEQVDWGAFLRESDFGESIEPYNYVCFGWGERRFLLETPTWAELKLSVAVPATLWPTPAALSVTLFPGRLIPGEYVRRALVPRETYPLLAEFIRDGFRLGPDRRPILIGPDETSSHDSNVYEASDSYHAFRTCNDWTNAGLKLAGLRTATWAPFEQSIFWHFPN